MGKVREIWDRARRKSSPSRSDKIRDGKPTGQHRDALKGAQTAYRNPKHDRAPPEQRSQKSLPPLGRGKQSAECDQRDGIGTRETDRQDMNTRSGSQSTPCRPLPSPPPILPMQGNRLLNEASLSNRQISAERDPIALLQTQITDVSVMYKTLPGGEETPGPEIRGSTRDGGDPNEEMDRIFDEILKIQKDFPCIHFEREITHPCSLSDARTALLNVAQAYDQSKQTIENMEQQYQTLQSESKDDLKRRSEQHKETISGLKRDNENDKCYFEGKISVHEKQQQRYEEVVSAKTLQIQQLSSDLISSNKGYVGEINRLKEQQQKQIKQMKCDASAELAETKSHLENQLLSEQTAHESTRKHYEMQANEMTRKHKDERQDIKRHFLDQRSQMELKLLEQEKKVEQERKVAEELQSKKRALEEALRLAKDDFKSRLGQTETKLDQERKGKVKEIESIRSAHEAEKRKMREVFEVEKTGLVKGLKKTVESLQGALVERDHFKAISDHELAHRFQDISIEVDEFARVQWDIGQESLWPFPGQSFRKSENQRRTKQYIIQNTLWVILYESIFCTPFRVLGNQGKSLEATWIEKFGQDPKSTRVSALCPPATRESEKWRYEIMKRCVAATSEPQVEWDHKVKREFDSCLKEVTEDMSQELGKVATVSDSEKQRMSQLVNKAASLWLEAGQQRCRMSLLMSDSGEDPVRSRRTALDSDGSLSLVVVPELRRRGNAQGERLNIDELVMDCKGKFSVFYAG